jgi:hypothetical protein
MICPMNSATRVRRNMCVAGRAKAGHCENSSTGRLAQAMDTRFYMATPQAMRAPPPPRGAGWSE